jgi:hypothetical protein
VGDTDKNQVELYAEYDVSRLMPFLRASNFYDLERAYTITKERDYVPEMVFLLGRMGNNKQALMLIIERLGDVQRVSVALGRLFTQRWSSALGWIGGSGV